MAMTDTPGAIRAFEEARRLQGRGLRSVHRARCLLSRGCSAPSTRPRPWIVFLEIIPATPWPSSNAPRSASCWASPTGSRGFDLAYEAGRSRDPSADRKRAAVSGALLNIPILRKGIAREEPPLTLSARNRPPTGRSEHPTMSRMAPPVSATRFRRGFLSEWHLR